MLLQKDSIILIGPLGTGKSHFARTISDLTGIKNYPIDKLKWYYRFKNGYDLNESTEILKRGGFGDLINYSRQFFGFNELQKILNNFHGIIDLGASDTHVSDYKTFEYLQRLFSKFSNVFLILPYEDDEKSIELLRSRLIERYQNDRQKAPVIDTYLKLNEQFIRPESNRRLAKHIIYSNDRKENEVALEIIQKSKLYNINNKMYYKDL
ncbi:MAG: hypothetical protein H8E74_06855 [Gammaproteobacteria bacterium]|nr:hypothetical protein [Gammaproteobacteria bacterium]